MHRTVGRAQGNQSICGRSTIFDVLVKIGSTDWGKMTIKSHLATDLMPREGGTHMTTSVTVVDHLLVQHKLTLLRRKEASTAEFRKLLREIGLFLGYEALRDLPTGKIQIETPACPTEAPVLAGKKLTFISVLRAGFEGSGLCRQGRPDH